MKLTIEIDGVLVRRAAELTGVSDTPALVRLALERLVARESEQRLAALGGSQPGLGAIPRRRATRA